MELGANNDGVVYNLTTEQELRFVVDEEGADVSLLLLNGYAEILGTEVKPNVPYTFLPSSSVTLFTWKGCTIKLSRPLETLEVSSDSLIMISVTMHACLEEMRIAAEHEQANGPISLVVGPTDVGKTSFCYFLLNYAARLGRRPVYVDLDVGQSSVSMPGSICILPVDKPSDVITGFSQQSLSVYPFGHKSPGHNIVLYFLLIKKLGQMIKTRLRNANPNTRSSGIVIDTCGWVRGLGYSAITLAACSFEIDILFVLEDETLYLELKKDMPSSVQVVYVPKQHGVHERSRNLRVKNRDNRIREYYYGPKGDLNPHKIEVKFSDVSIYTVKPPPPSTMSNDDAQSVTSSDITVESIPFGAHLETCILGLSFADKVDENLIVTNIIGFVCVMNVDMEKEVMTVLSPQPGPLPSKILLLGEMKLRNADY